MSTYDVVMIEGTDCFQKRSQLIIRVHNEALSVVAVCISNEGRLRGTRYEVALTFAFAVVEESIEHAIEERFGLRERDSGIEDCALEVEVWRAESQVNTALFLARILKPHHQPDYLFCSQAMFLAKFGRRRIVIDRYEQLLASRVAVYLVEQVLSRFPRPFRIQ